MKVKLGKKAISALLTLAMVLGLGVLPVAAAAPDDAPVLSLGSVGDGEVTLNWTAPTVLNSTTILGYTITYSTESGPSTDTAGASDTSKAISGLTNGVEYTFTIVANTDDEPSPASNEIKATAATKPDAPVLSVVGTPDYTTVELSWTVPDNGGDAITGYTITKNDGNSDSTDIAGASETTKTISGLSSGTAYTFTIVATNTAGGDSDPSASVSATTKTEKVPDPPKSFTATPGDGQVTLSWAAPDDTGGSAIKAYQVSSDNGLTWVTPDSNTGHVFNSLNNDTPYNFAVQAENDIGWSDSATDSATPVAAAAVPDAPVLSLDSVGDRAVTLTWTEPANNNSPIENYTITGDNGVGAITVNAPATSKTISGLDNGTTYSFTITATNGVGEGAASTPAVSAMPFTTADAPTGLAVDSVDDGEVTLSWAAPTNTGGTAITDYEVSYDNGTSWVSTSGTGVTHTVNGLENGTTYTFMVRAVTAGDGTPAKGAASAGVQGTPATTPGAPQNVVAAAGNKQVTLSWEAPASNGGAAIDYYEVSSDNGSSWSTADSNTSHTFTGLTNDQSYTFKVRAHNSQGVGADVSISKAPAATPATAPLNLTAIASDGSVTINWDTPSSDGGDAITKYVVSDGVNTPVDITLPATDLTYTFTGLTNGTEYTFTVYAFNSKGNGAEATVKAKPVAPATTPDAPANFTAVAGDEEVTLSWAAPANDGGAAITGYQVSADNGQTWAAAGSSTGHTFTGLTNGTEYTFKVRAVNSEGSGTEATVKATPVAPIVEDIDTGVSVGDNAPSTDLNTDAADIKDVVFTKDEQDRIDAGEKAVVFVTVDNISDTVAEKEKALIENVSSSRKYEVGMYLDLNLYKAVGTDNPTKMSTLNGKISLTIKIPAELRASGRKYQLIRVHGDQVVSVIDGVYNETTGEFTFDTDRFSTYALVYSDEKEVTTNPPENKGDEEQNNVVATGAMSPKTGDNAKTGLFIAIALLSAALLAAAAIVQYMRTKKTAKQVNRK